MNQFEARPGIMVSFGHRFFVMGDFGHSIVAGAGLGDGAFIL